MNFPEDFTDFINLLDMELASQSIALKNQGKPSFTNNILANQILSGKCPANFTKANVSHFAF